MRATRSSREPLRSTLVALGADAPGASDLGTCCVALSSREVFSQPSSASSATNPTELKCFMLRFCHASPHGDNRKMGQRRFSRGHSAPSARAAQVRQVDL